MKILFFLLAATVFAQTSDTKIIIGSVSYISSQNIYVQFENTNGIEIGDTLFIKEKNNYLPVVKVEHKSSTSCSGSEISNNKLGAKTQLFAFVKVTNNQNTEEQKDSVTASPVIVPIVTEETINTKTTLESIPTLSGKVSVQSYSNFSNNLSSVDYQRWRYTFQLNAGHIGNTGFSYSHYLNFAYRADDWQTISSNVFDALRVYDLALKYDFTERTSVWLGRHLNNKISNISSIDGLQFETGVNEWTFGAAVGSRPDFNNMGFNTKLFEYGAYVNRFDPIAFGNMQNTLGYFEQTNDFKTDRRFLYFQHSNSAIQNTRIFLSTEVDIFKKEMGESKSDFSLTSLYSSINIRPTDIFSIFLSYDARKNVIYYETTPDTLQAFIDRETRQGFRTRVTLRPVRSLYVGADYGYRFRKGDLKPSNNYGGYVTYSQIPLVETSLTISYNNLSSSYVKGDIWSANLTRPIIYGFDIWLGYRFTNYKF
ncbi:MAG: hypothetical protein P8X47_01555, partial [Ignavibacteriaceae bacterium]